MAHAGSNRRAALAPHDDDGNIYEYYKTVEEEDEEEEHAEAEVISESNVDISLEKLARIIRAWEEADNEHGKSWGKKIMESGRSATSEQRGGDVGLDHTHRRYPYVSHDRNEV